MSTPDIRLLGIVGPPVVPVDRMLEASRAAERGGITAIQLRVKQVSAGGLLRLVTSHVAALRVPVYVNDRADVAWLSEAAGVHVGADDLPPGHVRRFAPRPFRIGVSVGSPAEAQAVREADVDYWSVGPLFGTATKTNAGQPIGVAGFGALAARAPLEMPVIAIGGIHAANALAVMEAGAAGVAVSRAIFGAADVERAARELREVIDGRPDRGSR